MSDDGSLFFQARLLRERAILESLITEREGMVAANAVRAINLQPPLYGEDAFKEMSDRIATCAPDPHDYA